jgi:DNA-directed RNA polymerase III subunit RPC3
MNHDKVAALLRNRRLIDKVQRTIGHSAAQAYAGILKQSTAIPYRWQRRSEPAPEDEDLDASSHLIDQDSLLIAVNTQGQHDDEGDDDTVRSAVGQGGSLTAGSHIHINGYVNGSHTTETVRTVTLDDIKTHLLVLAQPPHKFVVQDPDSLRWTVDFRLLSAQLRREEAMRLAKSRLNSMALRLVRVLLDKGKLDEKILQEKSLLSAKDLRQCLSKLKRSGFVSLQEVPREPQRQPLKTIYLWFYDSDRVRKMLLGDLYKAMARLLRRLKVERDKVRALLEKAERIDVRGKEEKFLARGEMEVLEEWRGKEEWLLGEVERLDDSVAILRDI